MTTVQGPREPLDEKDAEIARLRTALSEIGASAAAALMREGIEGFGDGGALGDSLISIKDTVDETFIKA